MADSDPGFDELDRLTQAVKGLFQQATNRFAVPTDSGCRMVALYLLGLRDTPRRGHKKPKVVSTGELFLRQLAVERQEPEYWLSLFSQGHPVEAWRRKYQELLERINQTQQHIESLLPHLWPKCDERDPIRQIEAVATQAWQETNDGRAPRSANPNDPLCKFIEGFGGNWLADECE